MRFFNVSILCLFGITICEHASKFKPPLHHFPDEQDSRVLRDDKEIVVHLRARQVKRYYFQLTENEAPVRLRVTPCGGMVKWKLTEQDNKDGGGTDASEDFSGNFPGDDNPFSDDDDDDLEPRPTRAIAQIAQNSVRRETTLVREVDVKTTEYNSESLHIGTYYFYVTSLHHDISVRVYLSKEMRTADYFPKLPRRARINLLNVTQSAVEVDWEPSPSVTLFKQHNVEYCVVLSDKEIHAYCELLPKIDKSIHKLNDLYPGEQSDRLLLDDSGKKTQLACTVHKTTYKFSDLVPNRKYFLSLFAVNTDNGASVAYDGASFLTRPEKTEREIIILPEGRMISSNLNPTKDAFRLYQVNVSHAHRHMLINVQSCSGYLRVAIFKDGKLIRKSAFENLKSFVLGDISPGLVRIMVSNDDSDAKVYKIWASVKPARNPYPKLPMDTSIKVLENLRTCTKVTLAWLGVRQKHDYCLFKQMETDDYFKRLILEETDQCRGPPAEMQLVNCRYGYSVQHGKDVVMRYTVAELQPDTTYRFDLYVSKSNREQLAYRTIWVKTRKDC